MREKGLDISRVFDVLGFRILVNDVQRLLRGAGRGARAVGADPG